MRAADEMRAGVMKLNMAEFHSFYWMAVDLTVIKPALPSILLSIIILIIFPPWGDVGPGEATPSPTKRRLSCHDKSSSLHCAPSRMHYMINPNRNAVPLVVTRRD